MPSRNKNFIFLPKSWSGYGRTDRTGSAGPAAVARKNEWIIRNIKVIHSLHYTATGPNDMSHVAFHTFPVPDNSSPAFSSLAFSAPPINCAVAYANTVHDSRSTPPPQYGICYIRFLLTYKISISSTWLSRQKHSELVANLLALSRHVVIVLCCPTQP